MTLAKESAVVKWIDTAIKLHGEDVVSYRPVPSQYGARYVDYILCAYGFYAVIEAKRPTREPTERQAEIMRKTARAGGAAFHINNKAGVQRLLMWVRHCKELREWIIAHGGFKNWPAEADNHVC